MTSSATIRHETEIATRSVLLPNKDGLLLDVFGKEFKTFMGHSFPYEKLGYLSILELLKSMPEVVAVTQLHSGHILLTVVPEETTQDLARMVSKQKPNEEGYSRKTIQVVQQEKNRLLKLEKDTGVDRFNPSQNLNPNRFKAEMSGKLVTEKNTKALNIVQKLVSYEEKKKLRAVLAAFRAGIPLSQFSREYRNFFGHELRPSHYNCESIAQFCAELPDIFVIGGEGSDGYSGDWILHLAARPEIHQTQTMPHQTQAIPEIHQTQAIPEIHQTQTMPHQTQATPLPTQQIQTMSHQTQATPLPTQQTQSTLTKHRSSLANINVPDKSSKALSKHQASAVETSINQTEEMKSLMMECKDHPGKPVLYVADGDIMGCEVELMLGMHVGKTTFSTQQAQTMPHPTQQAQTMPHPTQQTQATPHPTQQTQATPLPTQQTRTTPLPTLPKHRSTSANINVPDKVVTNVKHILERFPEGIKKSKFLDVYQNLTGVYLNVKPFGFRKIDNFFHHLHSKGVFEMVNSILTLWKSPCDPRSTMTPKPEKAECKTPVEENTEDVTSREVAIFMNVMKPGDDVEQQSLAADMKNGDFMDIIVGEIFHPHKFWIQCKGNDTSEALEKLMRAMDTFYDDVETAKMLQVPEAFFVSGLICATLFDGSWHRVRVTSVQDPTNVCLFYIDYGTVTTAARDSVHCLDKRFGLLPAQAIPARLAGVKPAATASTFPRDTSLRFLELVKEFHGGFGLSSVVVGIGQFVDLWLFTNFNKKFSINQILVDENLASSDCKVFHEKKPRNIDKVDDRLSDFVGDDSTYETFDNIDSSGYASKKSTETSGTFGIVDRKKRKPSDIVRSILRKKELSIKQNKHLVNQGTPQLSSTKLQLESESAVQVAVVDETKRDEDAFTEIKKHKWTEKTNDEDGTVGGAASIECAPAFKDGCLQAASIECAPAFKDGCLQAASIECAPALKDGCLQAVRANIDGNVTAVMFDKNQTRMFNIILETMGGEKSSFGYVRKKESLESDLEANQGGTQSWSYDPKIENCRLRTVKVNNNGVVTFVLFDKIQTRCFTVCLETMDGKRSSFGYPNKMEDDETKEVDKEVKQEGGTMGGDWSNKYDPKLESNGTQTFTAGVDGYEMTVVIDKSATKCFTINLDTVDGKIASFGGPVLKPLIGD